MRSISIDTIKVTFFVPMNQISFVDWLRKTTTRIQKNGESWLFEFYVRNYVNANKMVIHLKFVPIDFYGRQGNRLIIDFSLPRLIYGCNHQMLEDLGFAMDQANIELSYIPGLPRLIDIRDAELNRLDICENFQVWENSQDYIQAIFKAHFPHRKTVPYPTTGVIFKAKSGISTSVYLKYEDPNCGHEEARGKLRFEISMRRKCHIVTLTGKKEPRLRDLTIEMVAGRIQKDMNILHLNRPIVCDRKKIENILSEKYTPRQVRSLLGYLLERQTLTYEQLIGKGITRRTICHYEKLLAEAGVSSLSIESNKVLPPLSVNKADDKSCNKALSDTRTYHRQSVYSAVQDIDYLEVQYAKNR